jgi:hypothetical protein
VVTATVMGVGEACLKNLADAAELDMPDRSALHFIDLLLDQEVIARDEHVYFQNKHYQKCSVEKIGGDPRIFKAGMSKDVRLVGDSMDAVGPILQLDRKWQRVGVAGRVGEGFGI